MGGNSITLYTDTRGNICRPSFQILLRYWMVTDFFSFFFFFSVFFFFFLKIALVKCKIKGYHLTAVQLSKTHRMRSCYGRTVILLSSRHPRLLEPEKRFALDLCWSSSIQKQYNPLYMFCRKNHSAWHSQCKSNRFWTKKKKRYKNQSLVVFCKERKCTSTCCL